MKVKITNSTGWSTRSLRKIILRGLAEYDVSRWSFYEIKVVPAHQGNWCSGQASYNHPWIKMRIPSPALVAERGNLGKIVEDFARVFEHEVMHNLGLHHEDMGEEGYDCRKGDAPEWAKGLTLEPAKARSKPARKDRVAAREDNAKKMAKRWERRLKLARTKLSYWTSKVRYYDRRSAAQATGAATAPGGFPVTSADSERKEGMSADPEETA